jgi:hypothetical protein
MFGGFVKWVVAGGLAFFPSFVRAGALGTDSVSNVSAPQVDLSAENPFLLDQPPEVQAPLIHGYIEAPFKTAHITPRGLVVADKGVEIQPSGAFRFDLYDGAGKLNNITFTTGIWNSVNTSLKNHDVGGWFEVDYFAKMAFKIDKRTELSAQYISFISPSGGFVTDHNVELTLSYDDTGKLATDFGVRPYARLFYNISGSSTTVLGQNGNTYDVELGAEPTYTLKTFKKYPITFTLPTYITVGPGNFWGDSENVGVFTTKLDAQIPLSFIPVRYGYWHADIGVSYFYLLNGNLVRAAEQLGNAGNRNWVVGVAGIGVQF